MKAKYDIVIIGAGVGGVIAALTARKFNKSVLLIEKEKLGGASFNWGALPFQELIKVAKSYQGLKESSERGIDGVNSEKLKLNWPKIKANAQLHGRRFKEQIEQVLQARGVDFVTGHAEAFSAHQVEVNGEMVDTADLILASGSNYLLPDFVSPAVTNFFTPKNVLSINELPKSLAIVGGGLLGVEYALLFSSFDVQVTLIEEDAELMHYLDRDLKLSLAKDIRQKGIKLMLNSRALDFANGKLKVTQLGKEVEVSADIYLSALKRIPSLDGAKNLLQQGLELRDGYIRTDQRLKTTLPHVYAIGDVNGRAMLAHVASKEGETAVEVINGSGGHLIYELLHYNMYAIHQMASVGMTEETALQSGFLVSCMKLPLHVLSDQYVKVVYDKQSEEVLGVHIYAENASDLICEAQYVMERSESIHELAKLVHAHPIHSMEIVEKIKRG